MKHAPVIALVALLFASSLYAEEKGIHLFILSGQSNMRNLNPDLSFTPAVTKEFGKDNIIVIKQAQGGQPIRRWYKKWTTETGETLENTGDLYDGLIKSIHTRIKDKQIDSVTFIWMQGESDARGHAAEVYADSMNGLLDQLRDDLGRKDINFVIGRISDHRITNPDWLKVREAQVAVAEADPRGAWIDTDDLNNVKGRDGKMQDGLHYAAEGYVIMGQRFADKSIALIKEHSAAKEDK